MSESTTPTKPVTQPVKPAAQPAKPPVQPTQPQRPAQPQQQPPRPAAPPPAAMKVTVPAPPKDVPLASLTIGKPAFPSVLHYAKRRGGKTLAGLNSPWGPVLEIDCDNSAMYYENDAVRLIEKGFLRAKFQRVACFTVEDWQAVVQQFRANPTWRWGTIVLDTAGQVATWVTENQFKLEAAKVEKQSQIIWGHVRDQLRRDMLLLQAHCDLLVLNTHLREWAKDRGTTIISPRVNPSVLEITDVIVKLERDPRQRLPVGYPDARSPYLPTKIPDYTLAALAKFYETGKPGDEYGEEFQMQPEPEPEATPAPNLEDLALEEG